MDCRDKIISEDYADFIIGVDNEFENVREKYRDDCIMFGSVNYGIIYKELSDFNNNTKAGEITVSSGKNLLEYNYYQIPKLYSLMDTAALEETGSIKLQNFNGLELKGKDIVIGFISDGIDVYNKLFRYSNGETRVIGAWDQTNQDLEPPINMKYGSFLDKELIDEELQKSTSTILDSLSYGSFHGTFEAGIAAGNISLEDGFSSAAPLADIAVVKLKPAKKYLKRYYYSDEDAEVYQENDIMTGIIFLTRLAASLNKALIICIVTGSSQGAHNGFSVLGDLINQVGVRPGIGVSVASGNEGNTRHHYSGKLTDLNKYIDAEIRVEENLRGLSMELWAESPDIFTMEIISPSGEKIPKIALGLTGSNEFKFLFQNTVVYLKYEIIEKRSGAQVIEVKIDNPSEGIWTFRIFGIVILNGNFNLWLPVKDMLSEETYFLKPDPFTTLTIPSDAFIPVSAAAYNDDTDGIFIDSGRGYTTNLYVKPTISAPGVNINGPTVNGQFIDMSGTSISAAITAGIMAQFMEWGARRDEGANMSTVEIKNYLIRGATRRTDLEYPDREFGFGLINAYNSLDILKG